MSELAVIVERVENLKSQLEGSDKLAEAWRVRFSAKLDIMGAKIDGLVHTVDTLPCPERGEQTKGLNSQMKALWILTGGMLITIISEWLGRK